MFKKVLALLLAAVMLSAGTAAFAESKGSGGRFVTQGDCMYYVAAGAASIDRNIPKDNVGFFLGLSGLKLKTGSNVCEKSSILYTDVVALSEIKDKNLSWKHTVKTENGATEEDVLAMVQNPPSDNAVFESARSQLMDKGYIISDKGEVVPWAKLNSKFYGIDWYIFLRSKDGWHIDGRIVDLSSDKVIDVVVPEDPKDVPPAAYDDIDDKDKPSKDDADKDNDKDTDKDADTEIDAKDTSISLDGAKYAYIFGYEPVISSETDEDGNTKVSADIYMGMDDSVTTEQVCAMLMRLLDQQNCTKGQAYKVTESVKPYRSTWFARGLAYQVSVGGLPAEGGLGLGNVTRAKVANFVAHALKLNLSGSTPFGDIEGNEYESAIKKVYTYGYMKGVSKDSFAPDDIMTRAEFCQLFNNIIGRDKMGLTALDEDGNKYEVTAEDYSFVDMPPSHWAYETCLKATSAYDDNGYVSMSKRQENIRNKLDDYDSQLLY